MAQINEQKNFSNKNHSYDKRSKMLVKLGDKKGEKRQLLYPTNTST